MMSDTPSLRETQRWMAAHIAPVDERHRARVAAVLLNPQADSPGEARLAVYAEGYLVRIREALAEVYEAVRHILGDHAFAQLARDYAAAHPSGDYNLSFAGRALPKFLAGAPIAKQLPFLPDLARLEWAVCRAFHAHEQAPIDASRLANLSPDALAGSTLAFQPSVCVIRSAWPILDLWQARETPREQIDIELVDRPHIVLLSRDDVHVHVEPISEPQARLLEQLLAGATLAHACASAASAGTEPLPVSDWFAHWMQRGLIVDLRPTS